MYSLYIYTDIKNKTWGPYPACILDEFWIHISEKLGNTRQDHFEDSNYLSLTIEASAKERRPHVVGAGAEATVSIIKKVPFNPTIDTYRTLADLGIGEVRYDFGGDAGTCTRIKIDDKSENVLISVGGDFPNYICFGWNYIGELRRQDKKFKYHDRPPPGSWAKDPKIEFCIPRKLLLPIESLNPELLIFKDKSVEEKLKEANKEIEGLKSFKEKYENAKKLFEG